ncbi:MAG: hypothetical protein DRO11_06485 [Methanobacteriota archaeon]|nr:MAG: hypothetical protein DRO11_06485 [Euryarchaeota archaeon]
MRRGYVKQFKPYIEVFGPGLVIYWYGFVNNHGAEPIKWCDHLYIGSKNLVEGEHLPNQEPTKQKAIS